MQDYDPWEKRNPSRSQHKERKAKQSGSLTELQKQRSQFGKAKVVRICKADILEGELRKSESFRDLQVGFPRVLDRMLICAK